MIYKLSGPLSLKKLWLLVIQLSTCRRAMVNKILCRKISRVWLQSKSDVVHARSFSEPRCQRHVAAWYLSYRWMICLSWITIVICSLWELGSAKPQGNNHKWAIYLTSWDLMFGVTQSIFGAFLVTKRWKLQKTVGFDATNLEMTKLAKVYWFLYTVTSTLAIAVTVAYWAAVYDSKIHHIDPLNIMLHVCNSLLMIADLCVANVPIKLKHFWWCVVIVLIYLVFSVIYYAAGGLDKRGYHYIYKVLDWKKPGMTLLVAAGGIFFLIAVHCLLCYLAALWDRMLVKGNKYTKNSPTSPTNEQLQKPRDVEIV
ncbi:protein rolling stone-like isoform X2 [Chelonus insularis]|uniref:protein rolling stone-like isoform X2 n=1 Tax=Chelonus insularis TaxID=460826 RepID=UPI00158C64E1|nr:protein rolling stone-like isoform X2 [Chelonus insularis]